MFNEVLLDAALLVPALATNQDKQIPTIKYHANQHIQHEIAKQKVNHSIKNSIPIKSKHQLKT